MSITTNPSALVHAAGFERVRAKSGWVIALGAVYALLEGLRFCSGGSSSRNGPSSPSTFWACCLASTSSSPA